MTRETVRRIAPWGAYALAGLSALALLPGPLLAGEERGGPGHAPGSHFSNPVVDSLGARIARAGDRPAPSSPPSRFTPSGSRLLLGPVMEGLVEDSGQREALREAVEAVLGVFEEEARKVGAANDLAGSLCFFVAAHWAAAHDGAEVPDEATLPLLRQLRVVLDTPETKAASDADKQMLYEIFAIQAALLLLQAQAAAEGEDAAAKEAVKAAGVNGLRALLDVDSSRVSITAKGGLAIAPVPPPNDSSPAPALPRPTLGAKAGQPPLSFEAPQGWSRTEQDSVVTLQRLDGDDFYGRSVCTLILVPGGEGGDLQARLHAVWDGLVLPAFEGETRPIPLLRRVGKVGCAFAQADMVAKSNRAQIQVAAHVLDAGSSTVALLSLVQGDASLYADATERVLASIRAGDPPPPRALFEPAGLVGTWNWSTSSIADYVTPAGRYAGDASVGMGTELTFTKEGAYTSHFASVGRGGVVRTKERGRFRIEGDMLVLVPEDAGTPPRSERILFLGPSPDGKGSLLLLIDPSYPLRPANISFYGQRFRRP